jgi:hypothetical protein
MAANACTTCGGNGMRHNSALLKCTACKGSGRVGPVAKHSPGPWDQTTTHIVDRDGTPLLRLADPSEQEELCTTTAQDEANFDLAMEAPELARVLLALVNEFTECNDPRFLNRTRDLRAAAMKTLKTAGVL